MKEHPTLFLSCSVCTRWASSISSSPPHDQRDGTDRVPGTGSVHQNQASCIRPPPVVRVTLEDRSSATVEMAVRTIPKPFELVDRFHQDLAAVHNIQARVQIIQRYVAILQSRGEELSADAEAIRNVAALYGKNGTHFEILSCIAKIAPDSSAERRQERAIKTLVACWSWDRVRHYQWERLPYKTLEVFVRAAKKFPAWNDFVTHANHQLLDRHEVSAKEQKTLRIGQHHPASVIQTPLSPLERSDIIAIIRICESKSDVQPRASRWFVPCLCLSSEFASNEERMALFVLQLDPHDMLIPSQAPTIKQCQICSNCQMQRPRTSGLRLPKNFHSKTRDGTEQNYLTIDNVKTYSCSRGYARTTLAEDNSQYDENASNANTTICNNSARTSEVSAHDLPLADENERRPAYQSAETLDAQAPAADTLEAAVRCTYITSDVASTTTSGWKLPEKQTQYLSILATPCQGQDVHRIEHAIHSKYNDLLRSYYTRTQIDAEQGPLYKVRSEWFTAETEHAKVWCPPECNLGSGSAISEEHANVWHYTMDVFIEHAKQKKPFIRPVLIKGNSMSPDLEHHNIEEFMTILQSAYEQKTLDVHSLEQTAAKEMPFPDFKVAFDEGNGFNAVNLRNLTRSHRPLFAMLPRFRLLDILIERAEMDSKKKTVSTPGDISSCSAGFNLFAAANAFSGAHQDSLGHTWVRNLDGLKFWMTMHPQDMQSNWDQFYRQGPHWTPCGKAKLTIIEKGDVFIMMPDEFDRATVHSVHSPEASLMEGAMFFDNARVLPALKCLFEIGRHQNSTNEAIAYQLPHIMRELEYLIRAGKYMPTDHAFQTACTSALRQLEELGCKCSSLAEHPACVCSTEGRRCTAWCTEHPDLPTLACMKEGATFRFRNGGCCTGKILPRKRKRAA
nr:hypothetical protein CFP56_03388 [Quercus suber]